MDPALLSNDILYESCREKLYVKMIECKLHRLFSVHKRENNKSEDLQRKNNNKSYNIEIL